MAFIACGIDVGFKMPGISFVRFERDNWTLEGSLFIHAETTKTERDGEREGYVSEDDARRITHTTLWAYDLIKRYQPKIIMAEFPSSGAKSSLAMKGMAMASGSTAALMAILAHTTGIKVVHYTPYQTKKTCTGLKDAEKLDMIRAATNAWPTIVWPKKVYKPTKKPRPEKQDEDSAAAMADSLCAILTHVRLNFNRPTGLTF